MKLILFLLMLSAKRIAFLDVPGRCGLDYSPSDEVREGLAAVETYPWLGRLYYPIANDELTTIVVLITKEMVIGPAFDIDKYPKTDFRAKAKVILGSNCNDRKIGIRDYTYHPDYKERTMSALAIILLDVADLGIELHPICTPPTTISSPDFYSMILTRDCVNASVRIYEMTYVDPENCKTFYRKSGLDVESMWPTHTACAKALWGGKCVWRNGAVLMLRQHGRWSLVGIGVYGPGCESPARFLDYRMSHAWVRATIARIGTPAVTRMGPDEIIVRRSLTSIQRFGECDEEERERQIFNEETTLNPGEDNRNIRYATYNLTLLADVDYSCVIVRVLSNKPSGAHAVSPRVSLRRWCSSKRQPCFEFQLLQVEFNVLIEFVAEATYQVLAYGRKVRLIDKNAFMKYLNRRLRYPLMRYNDYETWKKG